MGISIADIISKYVELTKLGPGYTGACPFCGASGRTDFKVSVQHQKYTCEKCGASGGVFQFLLNFKDISLEEALNELKGSLDIHLDANLLDSRWNEILKGTDFQNMLNQYTKKGASVFDDSDLIEGKGILKKGEAISYTALATFIRCPLEYKLRYRDKIKAYEPAGTRVNLGRFLHSVASQFLKLPFKDRISQSIELQFQKEIDTSTNAEYIDELRRFREPTSMLLLANFADKAISDRNPHFRTPFGLHTIVGTADCLVESSNGIQVVEFKEYDYREFEDDLKILHYLQLFFYYFGLRKGEIDIPEGLYGFFNSGDVDGIIFSEEIVDEARTFIEAKLHELADCRNFAPRMNRLCISCGYRDKCKLQIEAKGRI